MQKPLLKSRWLAWENDCLTEAFQKNIQLKIIALALDRTVDAVSKKMTALDSVVRR